MGIEVRTDQSQIPAVKEQLADRVTVRIEA